MDEFDVKELIVLLSPKAIDWRHVPGGTMRLTPQDIAARLSRCSKGASYLARAKYANDQEAFNKLYFHFAVKAANPEWPKLKPGILTKLVNLTITEVFAPRVCPWCNGREKFVDTDGRIIVCGACRGSGDNRFTDRRRARMMGMPQTSFRRLIPYHIEMLTIFANWETEISDAMLERKPKVVHTTVKKDRASKPQRAA